MTPIFLKIEQFCKEYRTASPKKVKISSADADSDLEDEEADNNECNDEDNNSDDTSKEDDEDNAKMSREIKAILHDVKYTMNNVSQKKFDALMLILTPVTADLNVDLSYYSH